MKITIDNYESWFLDYAEEKLNPGELAEVRLFLIQYPDLAEELTDFMPTLTADNQLNFSGKERLKRTIFDDPALFETSAIAAMEGDLDREERIEFTKWLEKNPDQQKIVQELGKYKLHPNLEIGFPAKAHLKKRSITRSVWIRVAAAAAVLLIVLLTFYPEDQVRNSASSITKEVVSPDFQINQIKTVVGEKNPTLASSANPGNPKTKKKRTDLSPQLPKKAQEIFLAETRSKIVIQSLESKSALVQSYIPDLTNLMPVVEYAPVYAASNEISLSDYLKSKLKGLRASGPKVYYTREEVTVAGLRLFSRLPGNHLTARKGSDGRLKTISFNTHLLAFSIPVNR